MATSSLPQSTIFDLRIRIIFKSFIFSYNRKGMLGFEVEWFDPISKEIKMLFLKFFMEDNTVELLQGRNTAFLKRIFYPNLTVSDLFIGNSVTIFNRLLVIKKAANSFTEEFLTSKEVRFLSVIEYSKINMVGSLIQIAHDFHLNLGRVETSSKGEVLLEFLCFNRSVSESYPKASSSIATSTITSFEEISETFNRVKSIRVSEPCTLCIIKPHVLKANQSGTLINTIVENGFKISGIVSVHLSPRMTEELFDVYRNIYRPYSGMVQHYCSAPVLALMITGDTCDIVAQFRELSGPLNPDIALSLRPKSLRALFGVNIIQNAVHCTDLSEDGEMECRYIFETIHGLDYVDP